MVRLRGRDQSGFPPTPSLAKYMLLHNVYAQIVYTLDQVDERDLIYQSAVSDMSLDRVSSPRDEPTVFDCRGVGLAAFVQPFDSPTVGSFKLGM